MYSRLFKIAVITITILTANLITGFITEYLVSYKSHFKPIKFTLIAMGILIVVFYPLFTKLEEWLNAISIKMIRAGKSLGGKYFGLVITFFICLFILLYFYAKLWYNINVFEIIISGKSKLYF